MKRQMTKKRQDTTMLETEKIRKREIDEEKGNTKKPQKLDAKMRRKGAHAHVRHKVSNVEAEIQK